VLRDYNELIELARICWRQAHLTPSEEVAYHLRNMAREYQHAAAKLDGGKLPDLGDRESD
jgi:hypothetical protein